MDEQYMVDFESWFVTARNIREVEEEIERRFSAGDIPKVMSIEESD